MPFSYADNDRERWEKTLAAALVAAAVSTRKRIAAALDRSTLPGPDTVFSAGWWDDAVHEHATDAFQLVATEAADSFVTGVGLDVEAGALADLAAGAAVTVLALALQRGETAAARVETVMSTAVETGMTPEQVAVELGVAAEVESGPLSDAVAGAIGSSLAAGVSHTTGDSIAKMLGLDGTKTWNAVGDDRTREAHDWADGQTVGLMESFEMDGESIDYPGDPNAPDYLTAGCRCWLTYDTAPTTTDDEDVSSAADQVESDLADGEEPALAASASARNTGSWMQSVHEFAASPDFSDGVCITLEPTVDQRRALAVVGGMEPGELHVTLAYLGSTPSMTDDQRHTIATVLSGIAGTTGEMAGTVGGVGYFGSADQITVGLIDSPGLARFRTRVVDALKESGITVSEDHDFVPHLTFAWAQVNAADKVGLPLSFPELRLRWGTEVLAFDLLGAPEPAPAAPAPESESAPTAPVEAPMPETEMATAVGTVETFTPGDSNLIEGSEDLIIPDEAPVDLSEVPSDALLAEVERRVAERAIQIAEETGSPEAADVAAVEEAAEVQVEESLSDVVDDLVAQINGTPCVPDDDVNGMPDAMTDVQFAAGGLVTAAATFEIGTETETVAAPAAPSSPFEWEGALTLEARPSDDGRMFAEQSLTWRELPLPLMLLVKTTTGHQEAVYCGSINEIERVGNAIVGRGYFDDSEVGKEARRLLSTPNGAFRGVSVDVGGVTSVYCDPAGEPLTQDQLLEAQMFGGVDVVELMTGGRILGATLCPFQAFEEATVYILDNGDALVASGGELVYKVSMATEIVAPGTQEMSALVASAAGPDPDAPPTAWFNLQPMPEPIPFSVAPDGRCYGLVAAWDSCHIGYGNQCVRPPKDADFRSFYCGKSIVTREGSQISCGPIIMDTVHPDLRRQASDAQAFYAHTGSAVADVALHVNEHGIVAAGAIRPGVDPSTVRRLRASDISPDWRSVNRTLKLVSLLAVNTSGFLVEGLAASAGSIKPWAARDEHGEVLSLVAAGAIIRPAAVGVSGDIAALQAQIDQLSAKVEDLASTRVLKATRHVVQNLTDTFDVDAALAEISGALGIETKAFDIDAALAEIGSAGTVDCGCQH